MSFQTGADKKNYTRNIEMTPFCKVEVTLPRVFREVRGGADHEQAEVHRAASAPRPLLTLLAVLMLLAVAHAQPEESTTPARVDTEHIFGFTEGADVGEMGERELENATTGRFGKPGHYSVLTNEASFRYVATKGFQVGISMLTDYHDIAGVPNLADRRGLNFNSISTEFRWQIVERGRSPFGVTISFAPQWERIENISGESVRSYAFPISLRAMAYWSKRRSCGPAQLSRTRLPSVEQSISLLATVPERR